jgi:uncharacterized membrane protein YgdD (TMEM256/DUF423 family)
MKPWVTIGAINALLAVAAGAFGAHALKSRIPAERLVTFETGARYHMYHALALLAVGLVAAQKQASGNVAGGSMLAGIVLFSGSLYALALSGVRVLGAITPFGGLAFMIGWASLAWMAAR